MKSTTQVYEHALSDDIKVTAEIGYGTVVVLYIQPGSMTVSLELDSDQARDIGLALMDAANAADRAQDNRRKEAA